MSTIAAPTIDDFASDAVPLAITYDPPFSGATTNNATRFLDLGATVDTGTNVATFPVPGSSISYQFLGDLPLLGSGGANSKFSFAGIGGAGLSVVVNHLGGSTTGTLVASGGNSELVFASMGGDPWNPDTDVVFEVQIFNDTGGGPLTLGAGGADPHFVCLDGSRIDLYHDGFYRIFHDDRVVVNGGFEHGCLASLFVADMRTGQKRTLRLAGTTGCVHAEKIEWDGENDQRAEISTEDGSHTVILEAKYRAFALSLDRRQRFRGSLADASTGFEAGGILAALVQGVGALDDEAELETTLVEPGRYAANALACDAGSPHLVTFTGSSRRPEASDDHLLLGIDDDGEDGGGLQIRASLDERCRLRRCWVTDGAGKKVLLDADWNRAGAEEDAKTAAGYRAPRAALSVRGPDGAEVEFQGPDGAGVERGIDFVFPVKLAEEDEDGKADSVLVRLQANGTASFAVTSALPENLARGWLVEHDASPILAAAPGSTTTSLYERLVEPHLALDRGERACRPKQGRVSAPRMLGPMSVV